MVKKVLRAVLLAISIIVLLEGLYTIANRFKDGALTGETSQGDEERRRIALYVTVMKAAFEIENGGNAFIAVDMNKLEGLSDEGKAEVLKGLGDLSPNVYNYDEIKSDSTKFVFDDNGELLGTKDGTFLSIKVIEYGNNKSKIIAVSWFGVEGAVYPEYEATYKNGKWELKQISIAVS